MAYYGAVGIGGICIGIIITYRTLLQPMSTKMINKINQLNEESYKHFRFHVDLIVSRFSWEEYLQEDGNQFCCCTVLIDWKIVRD